MRNAGHSALDKATITGSATEMLMGEFVSSGLMLTLHCIVIMAVYL